MSYSEEDERPHFDDSECCTQCGASAGWCRCDEEETEEET